MLAVCLFFISFFLLSPFLFVEIRTSIWSDALDNADDEYRCNIIIDSTIKVRRWNRERVECVHCVRHIIYGEGIEEWAKRKMEKTLLK